MSPAGVCLGRCFLVEKLWWEGGEESSQSVMLFAFSVVCIFSLFMRHPCSCYALRGKAGGRTRASERGWSVLCCNIFASHHENEVRED